MRTAGWSGDGKQLLVTAGGRIALVAVDSGALRVVKSFRLVQPERAGEDEPVSGRAIHRL